MRRFNSGNSRLGGAKCLKAHPGLGDFLDETVILFDEIIQIFDLKNFNKAYDPGKHQQEVNILQPNIICATFVHNHFL
jgi:hypothetical protein